MNSCLARERGEGRDLAAWIFGFRFFKGQSPIGLDHYLRTQCRHVDYLVLLFAPSSSKGKIQCHLKNVSLYGEPLLYEARLGSVIHTILPCSERTNLCGALRRLRQTYLPRIINLRRTGINGRGNCLHRFYSQCYAFTVLLLPPTTPSSSLTFLLLPFLAF
jgi:hypothetical protein